ncbi:MAG: aspartate dehydrogenase [Euryarchaeota archaeon]|nr:aspartate dehydrogenase [Euryarchaeota archaeon]
MLRLAVLGCGAIGMQLIRALAEGRVQGEVVCVHDLSRQRAEQAARISGAEVADSLEELLHSDAQVVVECASIAAAKSMLLPALELNKQVVLLSTGALADAELLRRVESRHGSKVHIPSGAIGALDALRAAREGELRSVLLRTTKPPRALEGSPYVRQKRLELGALRQRTKIFSGNALEAISAFPANINVAVAVSLAGLGTEKTQVEIHADPAARRNIHELFAEGDFGRLYFRTENLPSRENPRTSQLAVLSALALLRRLSSVLQLG